MHLLSIVIGLILTAAGWSLLESSHMHSAWLSITLFIAIPIACFALSTLLVLKLASRR